MLRTLARSLAPLIAAVWLAAVLSVPAHAQQTTPQADLLHDRAVPEGIEGLTLDRTLEELGAAARAGDLVRTRALLEEAAHRGSGTAAHLLAVEAYGARRGDWRSKVAQYGRLSVEARPIATSGYLWLGLARDHSYREGADEGDGLRQTDLFYRIYAWQLVALAQTRSEILRNLHAVETVWLSGDLLPNRLRSAVTWALRSYDLPPAELYGVYDRHCLRNSAWTQGLQDAGAYCWGLVHRAAQLGHVRAMYAAAVMAINGQTAFDYAVSDLVIQRWLCESAESGNAGAAISLAKFLSDPKRQDIVFLPKLAYLLEPHASQDASVAALLHAMKQRMSPAERSLYASRFGAPATERVVACAPGQPAYGRLGR